MLKALMYKYRLIPVSLCALYAYMSYKTWLWFTALKAPTVEQAGFAGAVLTAGAAWFKFYVESGNKDGK